MPVQKQNFKDYSPTFTTHVVYKNRGLHFHLAPIRNQLFDGATGDEDGTQAYFPRVGKPGERDILLEM